MTVFDQMRQTIAGSPDFCVPAVYRRPGGAPLPVSAIVRGEMGEHAAGSVAFVGAMRYGQLLRSDVPTIHEDATLEVLEGEHAGLYRIQDQPELVHGWWQLGLVEPD